MYVCLACNCRIDLQNADLVLKWAFSGISTFAHLPHVKCLTLPEYAFDIGIIGMPFDTSVSYRTGTNVMFSDAKALKN